MQFTKTMHVYDAMGSTLFIDNRMKVISLAVELRPPSSIKRVKMQARGCECVIAPLTLKWDSFFKDDPQVADHFLPQRAEQMQSERESL